MQRTHQLKTAQSKATSSADLLLDKILQNLSNRHWKPRGYVEKDACFFKSPHTCEKSVHEKVRCRPLSWNQIDMGKTHMLVKSLMTSLGLPKKFEGRIWPQLRMWSAISTVNSPPSSSTPPQ